MLARCLPRQPYRRRATQGSGGGSGGFVQAAVAEWSQTGTRPVWLSDDLLRILEARGHLAGLIYLAHFERPIGDATNPRGFALHYTEEPASSRLLKGLWQVGGGEFGELAWPVGGGRRSRPTARHLARWVTRWCEGTLSMSM
jgi:hypothetical protein